jgi:hypothetical protein
MSFRKKDYGVNYFNPDIINGLKVKYFVMGEARRKQGKDENEVLSSNREAHKPTDNIVVL